MYFFINILFQYKLIAQQTISSVLKTFRPAEQQTISAILKTFKPARTADDLIGFKNF